MACDVDNVQDVNCFGDNSGSITVIASDGGGTYTYSLNGGTYGTNSTFSDLTAGTYTVSIQDQYGTTTECSDIIVGGPTASLDCSQVGSTTAVSCNKGSDGAFEVSASGGTSPYTYSLNGGTPQSSGSFSGLTAGDYTVEIEDANGCTVTCTSITISEPPSALAISIDDVQDVTCNGGNDGEIQVSGSGGTTPYQYSLNGGTSQTSGVFTGLPAGTYTIGIEDTNGCTETSAAITIGEPGSELSCTVSCNPDNGSKECNPNDNVTSMNTWNAQNIAKLEGCITGCINDYFVVTSDYDPANLSDLCGNSGEITVTYTITDECDNSDTRQATYTITDNTAPSFATCPVLDVTEDCTGDDFTTASAAWNTANLASLAGCVTDACSNLSSVEIESNYNTVIAAYTSDCADSGDITVTYTVTDECGNSDTVTGRLVIGDDVAPSFATCPVLDVTEDCTGDDFTVASAAWNTANLASLASCVTDNCNDQSEITIESNYDVVIAAYTSDCADSGDITVTYTVTDECGNFDTVTGRLVIGDDVAPSFATCPVLDVTEDCTGDDFTAASAAWNTANLASLASCVTDNCNDQSEITIESDYDAVIAAYVGDCADSGDITVTYTVTDECGNSDTVTGRLVIGDDEAPSFATCPVLDVTEDCTGDDFTVASAAWNTANLASLAGCVTDNCNDQSEILIESDYDAVIAAYVGDCADSGDITVTYTVTDECGNSDTVTGRLIVGDDEAPSFATCPVLDVTEDCTGDDFTVASAAWNTANLASLAGCVTDNCNDQSEILIESDYDAVIAAYVGDCADSGDITVTYTVTDECGNSDTVTGRLIVGDDEAPSFATCPVLDVTEDCTGDDFTVASAAWNTANLASLASCVTDNCNDQSEILIESDYDAVIAAYVGDCADSGDITVTYTVTDECGNFDTVTGRLIVGDDEAPSFATCPVLDVTEDCTGDDFTVASAAWNTANLTTLAGCVTDNCNDQSEILIESDYDAVIAAYVGDCADSGDITVTYTVTDECGNFDTVTGRLIVGDDEAPSFATCPVLDVTEDCTGDDFTVASAAWNTANLTTLAGCVTDNCNDQSEILIESDYYAVIAAYVGDCADSGDITVTYTVTDECGNSDTVTGRLIVGDDEAPSFATCPVLDVTEDCTGDDFTVASAAWNTANLASLAGCVTDNCNDQSEILIESDYNAVIAAYVGDCADSGDITVTYTVTDECGNSDTVTGRLIVGDDEAPSFATCPVLDVTEDCSGDDFTVASAAWNTANLASLAGCVTDNCNDQSEITIESDYDTVIAAYVGDCADSGDITVTYTVTDECGNSDTVTGRLIVGDDEAPSFATCPVLDVTEDCTGDDFTVASAAWNTANLASLASCVTDNCNDQSEILIESDYDAVIAAYVGDCADSGDITVTYTVTDECGNFDTVTGRLIVGDDEAPSFATCPVLDVTEDCTGDDFTVASAAWNTANLASLASCVTDNCNDQSEILIESDYDAVIAAYVGDCADSGDITVTYTVTDECGNSDTVTGRLIVGDDEAPSFATCPVLDVTEDCTGDDFTVASAAWNTANLASLASCVTDNCNDQSEILIESDYNAVIAAYVGDCADSGDITVTYTVTDECGNFDTVTGRLIVGDDEAPSFATCPVLDVTEDCTGDDFTVASAAWNTANLASLASCVTDNCNDQSEILIESDYDAVIAAYVGDCADSGDITVTYTVTDECGNSDTVTGRLIVGDDEAPSFATCPVLDVTEDCTGDDFTVASAAWNTANLVSLAGCVTDNCNDQSEILIESDYDAVIAAYVGDCADSGDITVTYTVTDECGNSDTVTGRLIVGDDEAPSFATCPVLDVTEDCTGDDFTVASAAWNTANLASLASCVTDNCNDQSEILIESDYDAVIAAYVGDCADSGDIMVTYTVTDECGNSDTVTGRLIVGDDEAPSFAGCTPLDVTEDCTGIDFATSSASWNTANLASLAACVTDNCNEQSEIIIESDYADVIAAHASTCDNSGEITVTYTLTDECGNSDTQAATYSVGDEIAPSFGNCPVLDVAEDCTGEDFASASANWNTANLATLASCVTDNCSDVADIVIESDYADVIAAHASTCDNSGEITVTYTLTDECGNSDTQAATYSVGDEIAPSFGNCPVLDVTEDCTGEDFASASANWNAANLATLASCVTDNCSDVADIVIESDYVDVIAAHVSTCDNSGEITVTYTLTDECGNSDTQAATYSVGDEVAPSFGNCPVLDVAEDCTGEDFASASANWNTANLATLASCVTDNCSDVADIVIESDYADVIAAHASTCDNSGEITVTYTLTDECGNSDTQAATYSVGDEVAPSFGNCPVLDVTEDCTGEDFASASAAWNASNLATLAGCVIDNCSDVADIIIESDYADVIAAHVSTCDNSGDITVTYTLTDECGNSDTQAATYSVGDEVAPSFGNCQVLDVAEDCTGEDFASASAAWNASNLATLAGCVTDNCSDVADIIIESDYADVIAAHVSTCDNSGDITVTYTLTDECGNSDTQAATYSVGDEVAPSFGNCQVLDVAEDCTGEDFASASAAWNASNLATLAGCVTDNCSDVADITIESDYADVIAAHVSTCDNSGDITVTYTLTDECGNSDTQAATYSVGDDVAPSFGNCPVMDVAEDCTGEDFASASAAWNAANLATLAGCVTDNCSDVADITIESDYADVIAAHVSTCDNSGDITVTYTLTDECGNSDTQAATYSVGDDVAPSFGNCPVMDVAEDCTGEDFASASAAWNAANLATLVGCVTDNCSDVADIIIESDYADVITAHVSTCDNSGDITVTYTLTDECGNSDVQTGTFSVGDDVAPSFANCAVLDVTEDCTGEDFATASAAWNTTNLETLAGCVTDNCSDIADIIIESDYADVIAAHVSSCDNSGAITVTYTLTDECGNSDVQTATFSVGDDVAPSFANCAVLDVTEDCTGEDFATASAAWNTTNLATLAGCVTDNCSDVADIIIESDYADVIGAHVSSCDNSGAITVTYTLTDECGNSDVQTATFSVGDDVAPSFANCAVLDVTEDCTGEDFASASAAWNTTNLATLAGCVTDNCSDVADIIIDSDYADVIGAHVSSCDNSGAITVTYTLTDECGNSDVQTATFSVGDDVAPSFANCAVLDVTEDCTGEDFATASAAWNTTNLATLAGCVTDNCSDVADIIIESDYADVIGAHVSSCDNSGAITVTYTLTDECGNSDVQTATFSVGDDVAPSFANCAVLDVTEDCTGEDFASASAAWNTTNLATLAGCITDNCSDVADIIIDSDYADVIGAHVSSCDNSGAITVTYTLTDECGNSDVQTATFSVGDDVAPSFANCAVLDVTEDCTGEDFATASAAWNTTNLATLAGCITDNCSDVADIIIDSDYADVIGAHVSSCDNSGAITVTYTLTDECGNSDVVTATFSVGDDVAPSVANCEILDVIEDCTGEDFATASAAWNTTNLATLAGCVTDNCSDVADIIIESDYADVIGAHVSSCDNSGAITVTYTLTDECGNSDVVTATFSVGDDVAPSFANCAVLDVTEDCTGEDFASASAAWNTTNLATLAGCVTDNCSDVADIIIESDYADVIGAHVSSCDNSGAITVTYTLTDECGNSDVQTATFSVGDDVAPSFANCAVLDVTEDCTGEDFASASAAWNTTNLATLAGCVTDNCSDVADIIIESDYADVIGAHVSSCDNSGAITVTYTLTDECGNSDVVTATFSVGDDVAPSVANCEILDVIEDCTGEDFASASAAWNTTNLATLAGCVTDNCSDVADIIIESDYADVIGAHVSSCDNSGAITVTYTLTDECGNSDVVTATFSVGDDVAPSFANCAVLDVTEDCTGEDFATASAAWNTTNLATLAGCVTDNCSDVADIIIESDYADVIGAHVSSCDNSGAITVTYTLTDECGNSDVVTATFSIGDDVAPSVANCEILDVIEDCTGEDFATASAAWNASNIATLEACATDNCSAEIIVESDFDEIEPTSTCLGSGSITVTYTLTDECGNSEMVTATFSIGDTTAPTVITQDITIQVDPATGVASITPEMVLDSMTDDCSEVSIQGVTPNTDLVCGDNVVVLSVIDECGNEAEAEAVVTVNCFDISLEKDVSDVSPNVGDVITFTILVNNEIGIDATGVSVIDALPNGYANVTNVSNGGNVSGNTVTWSGLTIPGSSSVALTFDVEVLTPGAGVTYVNVAEVTAMDQVDIDSTPGNDDGDQSEDDEDSATVDPQLADVSLTKDVSNVNPNVGDIVTFTITVNNAGPSDASSVTVADQVPSGYGSISNISTGGGETGGLVVWPGLAIPTGGSVTLTFDAEVLASGDYKNTAEVTFMDQTDPDSTPDNDDGDQSEDDEDSAEIVPNASISGTVFEDTNGDGIGDSPLSGVLIELKDLAGNVVTSITTDANGVYEFLGITPGDYILMQTDQAGFQDVSDEDTSVDANDTDGADGLVDDMIPVTLTAGEADSGNDFVEEQLSIISGTVSEDINNDDLGDNGIAGVVIELKDLAGNVIASQTTDGAGFYQFSDIAPGSYIIMQTQPAGFENVSDEDTSVDANDTDGADGLVDNMIPVTLTAGEADAGNDFVEEQLASISGTVSEDINNDDSGDNGIAGVVIELKDLAGNVIASQTTDGAGFYQFSDIAPGSYIIMQTQPAGFENVSDEDTSVDANDTDGADGLVDNMIPVTLTPGEVDAGNDFVEEQLSSISGTVSEDINNDDLGDNGITGVLIELKDLAGNVVASQTTDGAGFYQFSDIAPGSYIIMQTQPAGYESVSDEDATIDANDTDGADGIVDNMIPVTLTPGEVDTDNNFVEEGFVSVGSTVFIDLDNSGMQDAGEQGIAGLTVQLFDTAGNLIATTATDANGDYIFVDQAPGEYVVTIPTADATYNTSSSGNGGDDQKDGDDNGVQLTAGGPTSSLPITLLPGTETTVEGSQGGSQDNANDANGDMTIDFGFFEPASIGNLVWFDINTNNLQDASDPGLAGVTVNLMDAAGGIIATTTTDSNGNYLFDGLAPGDYVVQFLTPAAYTPIKPNVNGITGEISDIDGPNEDPVDNDADENTGMSHVITLESGEFEDEVDAGFNLILEVELLSFTAKYVEDRAHVSLEWKTSNEVNSDFFIVERAFENGAFESIGRVEAVGNSTVENTYDLIDSEVSTPGTYLYRLRQVDNDNSESLSDIVSVVVRAIEDVQPAISVYPNPANDYINVDVIKGTGDVVQIEMFDLTGKTVILNNVNVAANGNTAKIGIPVSNLPSANYVLRVNVGNQVFAKKVTVVE